MRFIVAIYASTDVFHFSIPIGKPRESFMVSLEIGIITQAFELSCSLTSPLGVVISPSMEIFYISYHVILFLGYAIVTAITGVA